MKKLHALLLAIAMLALTGCAGTLTNFQLPDELQTAINVTDRLCTTAKEPIANLVLLVDTDPTRIPEVITLPDGKEIRLRDAAVRAVAEYKANLDKIKRVCEVAHAYSTLSGSPAKPITAPTTKEGGRIDVARIADIVSKIAITAAKVQAARSK